MTAEELALVVKTWVADRRRKVGDAPFTVSDDTDLLEEGVIDSLAFVELLVHLQTVADREIDLVDADPAGFTTITGLCRLVLSEPGREP